jgi:hypothetical protein
VLPSAARPKAGCAKAYMKSTKKRFSEGGTSEDKEAGLKASKGEDVGFFERLRMGNIDDPKSEAFKRLGAGRGASEREFKNRASNDPTADRVGKPVVSMPEDDTETRRRFSKSPDENPIEVLSDQYIGTPAPIAQAVMPKRQANPSAPSSKISSVPPSRVAIGSMQGMPEPEAKKPKEEEDDTSLSLAQRMARRKERMKTSKPTDERSVNQRFKEQFGFKNGGSVSASRGDGIAQRGKTRGKMC